VTPSSLSFSPSPPPHPHSLLPPVLPKAFDPPFPDCSYLEALSSQRIADQVTHAQTGYPSFSSSDRPSPQRANRPCFYRGTFSPGFSATLLLSRRQGRGVPPPHKKRTLLRTYRLDRLGQHHFLYGTVSPLSFFLLEENAPSFNGRKRCAFFHARAVLMAKLRLLPLFLSYYECLSPSKRDETCLTGQTSFSSLFRASFPLGNNITLQRIGNASAVCCPH